MASDYGEDADPGAYLPVLARGALAGGLGTVARGRAWARGDLTLTQGGCGPFDGEYRRHHALSRRYGAGLG
jgi:hypothetical protein